MPSAKRRGRLETCKARHALLRRCPVCKSRFGLAAREQEVPEILQILRDSCCQGLDGSWDLGHEEARQHGFGMLLAAVNRIAAKLGIELYDYEPENDEKDDDKVPTV